LVSDAFLDDLQDMETAVQGPYLDDLHLPNLSETERTALTGLLTEFSDIFAPLSGPTGCTTSVRHAIPTTG